MLIPYDNENHPVTGVYNAKLGIWLFLASEVLFFGALFSTYILLRIGAGGVRARGRTVWNSSTSRWPPSTP